MNVVRFLYGAQYVLVFDRHKVYPGPMEEIGERWFEDFFRRPFPLMSRGWWPNLRMPEFEEEAPSVDIFEEGDNVIVKAEMPGVRKEDIHVTLTEDTLIWRKEERTEG